MMVGVPRLLPKQQALLRKYPTTARLIARDRSDGDDVGMDSEGVVEGEIELVGTLQPPLFSIVVHGGTEDR